MQNVYPMRKYNALCLDATVIACVKNMLVIAKDESISAVYNDVCTTLYERIRNVTHYTELLSILDGMKTEYYDNTRIEHCDYTVEMIKYIKKVYKCLYDIATLGQEQE